MNDIAPAWVQEPNGRGTWKIIYSCCFTLSLCVFTAIHLKLKWVIVAILFPEIMLYMSGKQWFSASRLPKKLNKAIEEQQERLAVPKGNPRPFWSDDEKPSKAIPLQQRRLTKFNLLYGYFALMGGFIIDVSHLHNSLTRLTISPKGIAFLAKHGKFVEIPDTTIRDKSKADTLAKGLVLVQVSWMLVQTISRRIVGYPITLLEVHTLVHVACALGMYGLWFKKPLDIRDPAWVDISEFEDLVALMLVRNYGFGARFRVHGGAGLAPIKSIEHNFANGSESAYLHLYSTPQDRSAANDSPSGPNSNTDPIASLSVPDSSSLSAPRVVKHDRIDGFDYSLEPSMHGPATCTLNSGEALECGVGPALRVHSMWGPQDQHQQGGHLQISLTSRDVRRWTLAAQASRRFGEELYCDSPKSSVNYFTFHAQSIFLDRKGLQAGFYGYFCAWASGGLIAALTICMFYGAAHATAWTFIFPTDVERLLWRIACVDTIAGVVSLLAFFSIVVFQHEHGHKQLLKSFLSREPGIMPLLYRSLVGVGVLNFPFWILSRMYIIVETFISLRHVEMGVYQTVEWTDYIPHL
ncbi:MAG: hypothetical protein Q9169_004158 [Polycauliona sp. 2 TL-2023]